MNARKYLESFRIADKRIQIKTEQIEMLQERLTSITAPMDKEQVSHTKNVGIVADTVAKIVDMQTEIDQQRAALYDAKNEAFNLLDQLLPHYENILIDRYIEGKSIKEISCKRFLSTRQVIRRINEGIDELQVVIDRMAHDDTSMSPACHIHGT